MNILNLLSIRLLLGLINCYRWFLSPLFFLLGGAGTGCRFTPSCSQYAFQHLQLQGLGSLPKIFKRFCSCHPWGGSKI